MSDKKNVVEVGREKMGEFKAFAAKHVMWLVGALIIVVILLIMTMLGSTILMFASESFSPTSTMRYQQFDTTGMSESMTPAQILASPDFGCNARKGVGADGQAWDWLNTEVHSARQGESENFIKRPGKNDSQLSAVLAGR